MTIIGVVVSVTMPTLVQQKNNNEIKARVNKAYSTLSNAVELAKSNNGDIDSWNWSGGPDKILDIIAPNLNIKEKCVNTQGCFPNVEHKMLNDSSMANFYSSTSYPKARLADGSSLFITSNGGCYGYDDVRNDICGNIYIDTNGDTSPNKLGFDMFEFNITKEGVVPNTAKSTCKNIIGSGEGCAAKILYDNDFSYMESVGPIGHCPYLCGDHGQACLSNDDCQFDCQF